MTWTTVAATPAGTPNGSAEALYGIVAMVDPYYVVPADVTEIALPTLTSLNHPLMPVKFQQPLKGEISVDCTTVQDCCVEPPTEYVITAPDSSAYVFEGGDLSGPTANPTLTLERGKSYLFDNISGAHPFQIQSTSGLGGTAYNDGVTGNGTIGEVLFEVPDDAPSSLYYQCTVHSAMNGAFIIIDTPTGGGGGGSVRPTSGLVYPRLV